MSRIRRVSSGTAYPSPRFPNEPKKDRSLRTCAEVVPPRRASSPEEMVERPWVLACSRNRRYTDSRRTVLSEIFRIVNYFTIGDLGARESLATRQGAGPSMRSRAHDQRKADHVFEGVAFQAIVLPATVAVHANQARGLKHFQMERHARLRSAEDFMQLRHAAFPLRQQLEDE